MILHPKKCLVYSWSETFWICKNVVLHLVNHGVFSGNVSSRPPVQKYIHKNITDKHYISRSNTNALKALPILQTILFGSVFILTELCRRLLSLMTDKGWPFMSENAILKLGTFITPPLASLKFTRNTHTHTRPNTILKYLH